jgi:ATP-dependent Clp protease protease subunit
MGKILRESIDRFFDYDLHVESRTFCLFGDVDEDMASATLKILHMLDIQNQNPVTVLLNTEGGDFRCCLAIYDAIWHCKSHVEMHVLGAAWSSGSVILQAADDRVMFPSASVMVHDGWEENPNRMHAKNVERWAKHTHLMRQLCYDIYALRSKKPSRFWEKQCAFDTILNAEDTVKIGLADRVYQRENV